jgi:hypothetical protein
MSVILLLLWGCDGASGDAESTPDDEATSGADEDAAASQSGSVELLDAAALGSGWSEFEGADLEGTVFNNNCGAPEVIEDAELLEGARYESDAIVMHSIYTVEDAERTAEQLGEAVAGCSGRDGGEDDVVSAQAVSIAVDGIPPTDAYRLRSRSEALGMEVTAIWAVTTVDAETLSLIGVSVNDIAGEPPNPVEILDGAVEAAYSTE